MDKKLGGKKKNINFHASGSSLRGSDSSKVPTLWGLLVSTRNRGLVSGRGAGRVVEIFDLWLAEFGQPHIYP